jgi:hemerythrin-like domain-containing protein
MQADALQTRSMVERLQFEHEQGRHWIARMRRALQPPFRSEAFHEAARAYTQLLLEHIDKENTVLLPMAERLLSPEQLAALSRDFERFEVRVMGVQRHQALHELLQTLQVRYSI